MKYISEDKRIFDTAEACMTYEITLTLKQTVKLYNSDYDEITDYENLNWGDGNEISYIKIIDAENLAKKLKHIENTNDIDLPINDLYDLIYSGIDIINNDIYMRNYDGDFVNITLTVMFINAIRR